MALKISDKTYTMEEASAMLSKMKEIGEGLFDVHTVSGFSTITFEAVAIITIPGMEWCDGTPSGNFGNAENCDNVMVTAEVNSTIKSFLKADNIKWNPADDKFYLRCTYKVYPSKFEEFKQWFSVWFDSMIEEGRFTKESKILKIAMMPQH
jgi:hypothetical protein